MQLGTLVSPNVPGDGSRLWNTGPGRLSSGTPGTVGDGGGGGGTCLREKEFKAGMERLEAQGAGRLQAPGREQP